MPKSMKSMVWKLVLPVPIALAVAIAVGWYFISQWTATNTVDAAIASAAETVGQFKTVRGYYTKNIIAKVKANGTINPNGGISLETEKFIIQETTQKQNLYT